LTQVAQHAGVSVGTVSKVLNGVTEGFSVRDKVRERIMAAVEELGYRPDLLARVLRTKSQPITGIVSPRWYCISGVYDALISAIVWRLREADIRTYMSFPTMKEGEIPIDPWMRDGLIVMQPHAASDLENVETLKLPYVSVNGPAGPGGSEILVDDADGTRQAMRYLFDLGHRKIAYVGVAATSGSAHSSASVRAETYAQEMASAGLKPISVEASQASPTHAVARLLQKKQLTAILGYDHHVMAAVIAVARELGRTIPGDLSLVTFNDLDYMKLISPAPTVIRIPAVEMGRAAADTLIRTIADPTVRERIVLREELVVRASAAPVR
jgi:DNA-binding LacI/PurR family transcriptional regulator